ncbi:phage DNA invertase [Desulfocucumis palustris]|uniref:Phage DNA invertase n=1 Tax=Desulfocucumis palustris TaxID=1898651 RepID=A0A2L2XD95_9FIRM|nr:recombinase family protein [Desulfocucumis palustris]GBF34319.1 phage DNA invertase [Desulfocucumis palustris]
MIVAFYARVSTDEQAERGNIESQVDFAKKYFDLYAAANGITGCEYYLDDGVSGVLPLKDRPAASRLLADARAGKFNALFVYRLDRLARSVKHVLDTYDFLEERNIALKSMTEAFDTSTPTGKFFMTLLASIAALERDTILERTQMGKERAIKEGRWTSGQPPFGYRISDDKRLAVFEPEAEIIRMIFKLYLEGMRTIPIAEYLNARGIATPTQSKKTKNTSVGKWHAGHVSIILRNRAYIGEYKTMQRSKKQKEGRLIQVPSIVSREDFDKANRLLIENADTARGSRGREYLLRGLIYCGGCGRAFIGSSGNSKEGRVYYRCSGVANNGQGKRCDAKLIRAADIENAVWSDIQHFLNNPDEVARAIERTIKQDSEQLEPVQNELNGIENGLLEKQVARQKILSLVSKNIITDAEAEGELLALAGQIETLNHRKEQLMARMEQSQELSNRAINISLILKTLKDAAHSGIAEDKAELIRALVKRVTVYTEYDNNRKESRVNIELFFNAMNGLGLNVSGDA